MKKTNESVSVVNINKEENLMNTKIAVSESIANSVANSIANSIVNPVANSIAYPEFMDAGYTEKNSADEKSLEVYGHPLNYELEEHRRVHLIGQVNPESATILTAELRYLDSKSDGDIELYINSRGGEVNAGLAIIDCIDNISSRVITIATGEALSMGAVILCAGEERYATQNTRIMIHQPLLGGGYGQIKDIGIAYKEGEKTRAVIGQIIAEATGKSVEEVYADFDRNLWLSADEALTYGPKGLIDAVGIPGRVIATREQAAEEGSDC